jgi:ankyrin repeat protein
VIAAIRDVLRVLPLALLAGIAAAQETSRSIADAAMDGDMASVRSMIREGVDPNELGRYDSPALLWVARLGDTATAQLLLDAGAQPNIASAQRVAPLHVAAANGDVAMVRLLLDAGADPDITDRVGETPLFSAARIDAAEVAALLIGHGAAVDSHEPEFGQTPLHVAARERSIAVVRVLLDHGADVEARTVAGEIPRFRLPSENAGSKGVGIVRGGWPEHGMRYAVAGAKTPLLYAARTGDLGIAQLLVAAGADIERTDANGIAPLLNAILNASVTSTGRVTEHFALIDYLLERGADVNAADWYGETPLWAAVDLRNLDLAGPAQTNGIDRVAALRLIEELLERGADPNAQIQEYPPERRFITRLGSLSWVDFTGQTPFLRAALAGDTTVMKLLVAHGADPNVTTFGGTTPLMAAAGVNWVVNQTFDEGPEALLAAVRLAHDLGNDINAQNSMGLRAVHGAANRGSNDIIRYLAAHGGALDTADNEGRTPLTWAEGVFLATHPPVRKPETIALLDSLLASAH